MGFWDSLTDLVEAAAPWSTVEAEAAKGDESPAQADDAGEGETNVRFLLSFESVMGPMCN